jgi:Secretion system C-terminal sorting domain/Copper type II ascorbate-dependent monooxygenase, C-terminal domain
MKPLILLILASFAGLTLKAQSPKWAEDIAPILYKNCTKCHNPSGVAPFSLLTYNDAYKNRLGIKPAVVSKMMPPWKADPNYTHFSDERILSEKDINTIKNWVEAGAPQGDLSKAPLAPTYSGKTTIQNPDLVLTMPTYKVNTTTDLYRVFAIPSKLIGDRTIVQVEVVPGNRSIVHHVLAFRDTSSAPLKLDAADPQPGYTNFGGTGSNTSELISAWVPGQAATVFPKGMGVKLLKGSNIMLQVHYPGGILNQKDSTQIYFKFAPANNLREVSITPILNHLVTITNGPLSIPANTTKSFNEQFRVPLNVTLLSIAPHMHLIGRRIKVYGIAPTKDTIRFVNVPDWDFHWQGSYTYPKLVKIPAGTLLKADAFYDNTDNNPNNPNFPAKLVVRGESTTDEMMLVYFTYTPYQVGDENIIVDTAAIATSVNEIPLLAREKLAVQCYPNPAQKEMNLEFDLPESEYVNVEIFDLQGDLVKIIARNDWLVKGANKISVSTYDLPAGSFFLRVSSEKRYGVKEFIKVE